MVAQGPRESKCSEVAKNSLLAYWSIQGTGWDVRKTQSNPSLVQSSDMAMRTRRAFGSRV